MSIHSLPTVPLARDVHHDLLIEAHRRCQHGQDVRDVMRSIIERALAPVLATLKAQDEPGADVVADVDRAAVKPTLAPDAFFEALRKVTTLAGGDDKVAYMGAWEAFCRAVGYDPDAPRPPAPPPKCAPIAQWGETACRLHGATYDRAGELVCPVSGDVLRERPPLHVEPGAPP